MQCRLSWWHGVLVLAGSLFVIGSVAFAGPDDGLVLHYEFDGDGDVLVDSSGNGFDGTLGTAGRSAGGGLMGSGALELTSREGQRADWPADEGLVATGALTISVWVMPFELDLTGENRVIYRHNQFNLDLLWGQGRFDIRHEGAWPGTDPDVAAPVAIGEWLHAVGIFDPATGNAMYHNGALVSVNETITSIEANNEWTALGDFGLGGYVGLMDSMRYYHRALSDAEIVEVMSVDGGATTAVSPKDSLTATWGELKSTR
jgi:hypothetical protein